VLQAAVKTSFMCERALNIQHGDYGDADSNMRSALEVDAWPIRTLRAPNSTHVPLPKNGSFGQEVIADSACQAVPAPSGRRVAAPAGVLGISFKRRHKRPESLQKCKVSVQFRFILRSLFLGHRQPRSTTP
jgi:hypothetical protein